MTCTLYVRVAHLPSGPQNYSTDLIGVEDCSDAQDAIISVAIATYSVSIHKYIFIYYNISIYLFI
jgi:hypothetical protein